jgi:hypothetical protein
VQKSEAFSIDFQGAARYLTRVDEYDSVSDQYDYEICLQTNEHAPIEQPSQNQRKQQWSSANICVHDIASNNSHAFETESHFIFFWQVIIAGILTCRTNRRRTKAQTHHLQGSFSTFFHVPNPFQINPLVDLC